MSKSRPQSGREELLNSLTHSLGVVGGVVGSVLVWLRYLAGDLSAVALGAGLLYGASVIVLFGSSALYHAASPVRLKSWLRKADHCAIYVLIAGSYTPFTLVAVPDGQAVWLCITIWGLALVGIVMELAFRERREKTAVVLSLVMGWMGIFVAPVLAYALPWGALMLLIGGGVVYSVGVGFYIRNRRWDHVVWHGFVLGGAGLHGAAVMGFVL